MCDKVAYVNRRDARAASRWLQQVRGLAASRPYHCNFCGFWHLTSMSRKRAKRDIKARKERRRARTRV
jgi:hypothetical protein